MMPLAQPAASPYRAEIDGLRAFAVLSVVLYHAFPDVVPGGFIGVDVFFVISGYLITTHIFTSLDQGAFSFGDFFGRRIRRIFPALILVMVASLLFGWFALLTDELHQLGKHVASGAAFVVNFVLVGESGYFDTAAETKPMLHLWSLAVEEQFYILWPLMLWLAWRQGLSLFWLTLLVAIASFAINIRYATSLPTQTFFWPFGRFWELLSGSLLAWLMLYKAASIAQVATPLMKNIAAIAGLGLLLFGFTTISAGLPFPSVWATVPVGGAVLVIAAGATAWSNRLFMMNPVAVWFGLISYPLYLWHWPILSFLQIVESGAPPHQDARTAGVILAIALAWMTMRFVERPLRFGKSNVRHKIAGLCAAMIVVGLVGLAISQPAVVGPRSYADLMIKRPGAEHSYGPSSKWFEGRDNWLFLGNEYEDMVAKLKLAAVPDATAIDRERMPFARLAEAAEATGTSVALLISPNKSTIYPEFLPDALVPSDTRYISFFTQALGNIPNLAVVDPTETLRRKKATQGLLYFRTDTHWNAAGAFVTFSALAEHMGWPVPALDLQSGGPLSGDLIGISERTEFPVSPGDNWQVVWDRDPLVQTTPIPNQPDSPFGRARIVTNQAALSDQTVWVIGDSFTKSLAPFLDATFSEVHYLGHWKDRLEALPDTLREAQDAPDIILVARVERSF